MCHVFERLLVPSQSTYSYKQRNVKVTSKGSRTCFRNGSRLGPKRIRFTECKTQTQSTYIIPIFTSRAWLYLIEIEIDNIIFIDIDSLFDSFKQLLCLCCWLCLLYLFCEPLSSWKILTILSKNNCMYAIYLSWLYQIIFQNHGRPSMPPLQDDKVQKSVSEVDGKRVRPCIVWKLCRFALSER